MLTLVSKIVTVAEEKVIPENDEETDEVDDADLENLVDAFKHRCEYLLRNERHLVNSIERQAKYRSRLFNAHLHHLSTKHKTWSSEAIERMTMLNERIENEIRDKEARKSAETPAESSQNIRNSPSLKPTLDQIVPDSRCIEVDNLGEHQGRPLSVRTVLLHTCCRACLDSEFSETKKDYQQLQH